MCIIAEEFENRGIKKGIEKGIEKNTVTSIKHLMANLKMTVNQAMEVLEVPKDEREKYMKLLQ